MLSDYLLFGFLLAVAGGFGLLAIRAFIQSRT